MQDIQIIDFTKEKKPRKKRTENNTMDICEKNENTELDNMIAQLRLDENKKEHDAPFNYEMLLTRLFNTLRENNPNLIERKNPFILKAPQVSALSHKRTVWSNFKEICLQLKRPPEHISDFFTTELIIDASLVKDTLIFQKRVSYKQVRDLLTKYIIEYVSCGLCKTLDTCLNKDSSTRSYMLVCNDCHSTRIVNTIKAGYHAITKGDRKK